MCIVAPIVCGWGLCVRCLFCYAVLCALSSFAIILMRKRELVDFIASVLCLLLTVPWVGMQCVTVAFQGHTVDLLFRSNIRISKDMPMCYFFCSCFFICLFKIFCCF